MHSRYWDDSRCKNPLTPRTRKKSAWLALSSFSLASCYPPCLNGGNCVGPNICLCPRMFRGAKCQQGEYIIIDASKQTTISTQSCQVILFACSNGLMFINWFNFGSERVEPHLLPHGVPHLFVFVCSLIRSVVHSFSSFLRYLVLFIHLISQLVIGI